MYSLHLLCSPDEVDVVSAELWEHHTAGIRELDEGSCVRLIAGFEDNADRAAMLTEFAEYQPVWEHEDATDWSQHTKDAWPPRLVGNRLFLAPVWSMEPTPVGRLRLVHNPGQACGTGEHPCTQLALEALEMHLLPGMQVVDVGTGSGLLAIACLYLTGSGTVGVDVDEAALQVARENFALNRLSPSLVAGSADCLRSYSADLVIANISATVLLSILDDLLRITKPGGVLILSGFPEWELPPLLQALPAAVISELQEWRCIVATST